jgi:hypothetical protein
MSGAALESCVAFFPNQAIESKGARDGSSTHLHHCRGFNSAGLTNPPKVHHLGKLPSLKLKTDENY